MGMEDERLSLVPVEPEPKENGSIFARMHVRYPEEDAEGKEMAEMAEKAEKAKGTKELEAKRRAKKEKKAQDGGDRKRRRLA